MKKKFPIIALLAIAFALSAQTTLFTITGKVVEEASLMVETINSLNKILLVSEKTFEKPHKSICSKQINRRSYLRGLLFQRCIL